MGRPPRRDTPDANNPAPATDAPLNISADAPRASARERDDKAERDGRISAPLTDDGAIDWARVKNSDKRAKIKRALGHPDTLAELGASAPTPGAPGIGAGYAPLAVKVLEMLEKIILTRATGAPADVVAQVATFSPQESALLEPPLGRVIDKYMPASLGKYQDELELAGALVALTMAKIQALNAMNPANRPPAPPREANEPIQFPAPHAAVGLS